ncbi:hypothetical protein [Pelagicoccus sp. SDUM812003]|uniref:hypothetical protein n=1 Tax=Pelagicoccus sp. SDUM812003 TaxID=3041267 RepID=UPI00280C9699|nr:hypothetical protein [Pelagicoccus sp. SDUM812003]MDQ8205754.1 hypothetical protein [Pelagicoccus sp. SDUM812003]
MKTEAVYEILRGMSFDPHATHKYDILRGGFFWSDELPSQEKDRENFLRCLMVLAKPIAHRSELSLDKEELRFEEEWTELREKCPDWPGFRDERINDERIKRELKAIKYKEAKCLNELEKE